MAADDALVASPSQTVGPFFHFALTADETLGQMVGRDVTGGRIRVRIRVLDGRGQAVPDAMVELWHADAEGAFGSPAFRGWGRRATNDAGECEFETIRPGTSRNGGRQCTAHIDVCLFMRGMLRHVFTRIYFQDDPLLTNDPVLALVPASRRDTLIATPAGDVWAFEIRLQGDRETVFFDL